MKDLQKLLADKMNERSELNSDINALRIAIGLLEKSKIKKGKG